MARGNDGIFSKHNEVLKKKTNLKKKTKFTSFLMHSSFQYVWMLGAFDIHLISLVRVDFFCFELFFFTFFLVECKTFHPILRFLKFYGNIYMLKCKFSSLRFAEIWLKHQARGRRLVKICDVGQGDFTSTVTGHRKKLIQVSSSSSIKT